MNRIFVAEPVTPYAVRRPLVVDSSVVGAFLFGEPRSDEAKARMDGWALTAPRIMTFEVANIGMNKIRSAQTTLESAAEAMRAFGALSIEMVDVSPDRLLMIAATLKLSTYDASYVCVAEEYGAPLATFDNVLGRAALAYFSQAST